MPLRATPLVENEYYHIFNRGTNKQDIYLQPRDFIRFQQGIFYYQFQGPKPKLSMFSKQKLSMLKPISDNKHVEVICYCLMPNHFHLLLKQLSPNGILKFMQQLCNSYAKYFNTKYERVGSLWQGRFKAVRVESDEQFIHVSRYIHLNPVVSGLIKNIEKYQWSSYSEYMLSNIICSASEILNFFSSKEDYKEFIQAQVDYGKTLEIIKHHDFDDFSLTHPEWKPKSTNL